MLVARTGRTKKPRFGDAALFYEVVQCIAGSEAFDDQLQGLFTVLSAEDSR